ncbi:MAG: restriction endonuclease [Rhizomicrobium sp.]
MHRLHGRDFEILLSRIFQAQGFQVELGPGRGDEGVDMRLLQRDPLGDVLTLVQAKRYAKRRSIDQQAVAALHGVAEVEGAKRSLFITTSRYAPVAKRFAARTSGRMELATSSEVVQWCQDASAGIVADKSTLVSRANVLRIIEELRWKRDGRILHASIGRNMVLNRFALVIKETKHAALLMSLPQRIVTHDGCQQWGTEVPEIGEGSLGALRAETVWRTIRNVRDGRISYWDGRQLFVPWDGNPCHFDHRD